MKILIIGGGGREHAMAWKAQQSEHVDGVYVAPGNAGTALEPHVENIDIQATDIPALLRFAADHTIDLTLVGPEAPLAAGIVDAFKDAHLPCFGPTQAAARLESSKAFSKDFMLRHGIPTGHHQVFTEAAPAKAYIHQQGTPIVIKADGLASGKGVIVAHTEQEALKAVDTLLKSDTGHRLIIEEFLAGTEVSFIVMVDGEHILPLASSQDHKARDDGDKGPNTGGMGAYSPAPLVTPAMHDRIMQTVIQPTVEGLSNEGHPYTGFLYAGLMITKENTLKVLEYNCRLGDPETQPILMRLKSDFVALCQAALARRLDQCTAQWDHRAALGVVLAAGGYPGHYQKGARIEGLPAKASPDQKVFHAGTLEKDQAIVTAGGRVLCVVALDETIQGAQRRAYHLVHQIHWPEVYFRTDIGYRAIVD